MSLNAKRKFGGCWQLGREARSRVDGIGEVFLKREQLRPVTVLAVGVVATAIVSTVLNGCDDFHTCTDEEVPGISVKILDAESGRIAVCDATVWFLQGSYAEKVENPCGAIPDSLQWPYVIGAAERAGTYTVLVNKAGYVPWVLTNVEVTEDDCHVHTVDLVARLVHDGL